MGLGVLMTGTLIGLGGAVWALATGAGVPAAAALHVGGGVLASLALAGMRLACPAVAARLARRARG